MGEVPLPVVEANPVHWPEFSGRGVGIEDVYATIRFAHVAGHAATAFSSVRYTAAACAVPPAARIASAVPSACFPLISQPMTVAPLPGKLRGGRGALSAPGSGNHINLSLQTARS